VPRLRAAHLLKSASIQHGMIHPHCAFDRILLGSGQSVHLPGIDADRALAQRVGARLDVEAFCWGRCSSQRQPAQLADRPRALPASMPGSVRTDRIPEEFDQRRSEGCIHAICMDADFRRCAAASAAQDVLVKTTDRRAAIGLPKMAAVQPCRLSPIHDYCVAIKVNGGLVFAADTAQRGCR